MNRKTRANHAVKKMAGVDGVVAVAITTSGNAAHRMKTMTKEELDDIPKGSKPCDVCHTAPVTRWFGQTACAVCDSPKCWEWMRNDYAKNVAELDNETDDGW